MGGGYPPPTVDNPGRCHLDKAHHMEIYPGGLAMIIPLRISVMTKEIDIDIHKFAMFNNILFNFSKLASLLCNNCNNVLV